MKRTGRGALKGSLTLLDDWDSSEVNELLAEDFKILSSRSYPSVRLPREDEMHRSRLYLIVIDVNDLDRGVEFWRAALNADVDPSGENTSGVYARLSLPDEKNIRVLLQRVPDCDFWVLQDPFGNEFCVVTPEHRDVLNTATAWH